MMAQALVFDGTSDDYISSLQLLEYAIPTPQTNFILVKLLAAPINPLDLLVLKKKYPVQPQSFIQGRMVAGYDGVAEIISCGPDVERFQPGDRIIVQRHGLGTWRTHALFKAKDVLKIPKDMQPIAAAIARLGILNAYLLLENCAQHVIPGDWIIVNAATSVVAHFLTQFAKVRGINVISLIRDREEAAREKMTLQRHGAAIVLLEKELPDSSALKDKNIVLGFDAVFGEGGQRLIDRLSPGAVYVTYGFLGGLEPGVHVKATQDLLFAKNITFRGFRFSAALAAMKEGAQESLFALFSSQLRQSQLTMPLLESVRWNSGSVDVGDLREVIKKADEAKVGQRKMIFVYS